MIRALAFLLAAIPALSANALSKGAQHRDAAAIPALSANALSKGAQHRDAAAIPALSANAQPAKALMGGRISSKTYRIRRTPHRVEELSGDVFYRRRGRTVRARKVVIDHGKREVSAEGRIIAEQDFGAGERLRIRGERAEHDLRTGIGRMTGRRNGAVRFDRISASGELLGEGRARSVAWDEGSGELRLEGGRPTVSNREQTWSGAVQADRITAREGEEGRRRLTGEGAVRGWVHFEGQDRYLAERRSSPHESGKVR